jgi:hypothetical protein
VGGVEMECCSLKALMVRKLGFRGVGVGVFGVRYMLP